MIFKRSLADPYDSKFRNSRPSLRISEWDVLQTQGMLKSIENNNMGKYKKKVMGFERIDSRQAHPGGETLAIEIDSGAMGFKTEKM